MVLHVKLVWRAHLC